MIFGVSTYSFSQLHKKGELSLPDTVDLVKSLGFEAISFTGLPGESFEEKVALAKELRARVDAAGLLVSSYVVGADLTKPEIDEEIERVKREVDIAAILGTKNFRHDLMFNYNNFRSFDLALPTIAAAARKITEYAETLGIRTMTENHGFIVQDSERVERVVTAVGHKNFGVLLDMGNFLCTDESPISAFSRLANLAMLVHAKDFYVAPFGDPKGKDYWITTRACNKLDGAVIGRGDVPVAQCIAILRRAGYDGYVDIEFEGKDDCLEAVKESLQFLKSLA